MTRLSHYWLGSDSIAVWPVQNTFLDFYVAPEHSGLGKTCDSAGRKRALSVDSGSSEMRRRESLEISGSAGRRHSEDGNLWKRQQETPDCKEKQKFEDSAYQIVGAPGDSLEGSVPIKLCYPDDYKVVIEKVVDEQVVIEKPIDEKGADMFALDGQMSLVNDPDILPLAPEIGTATVMIRHIACRYTKHDVAEVLNQAGLQDTYVFIHVPISPRRSKPSNLGYAFVAFKSEHFADACRQRLSGKVFGESSSSKLCEICAAHFPEKMHSTKEAGSTTKRRGGGRLCG